MNKLFLKNNNINYIFFSKADTITIVVNIAIFNFII
jgi:hypothetical protein